MNGAALIYGQQEVAYPQTINFFNYTLWIGRPIPMSAANTGKCCTFLPSILPFTTPIILLLDGRYSCPAERENYLVIVNVRPEAHEFPTPDGWAGVEIKDLRSGATIELGENIALSKYQYMLLMK